MKMNYDADVIIIGAGHNSLAAGIYLAKTGLKVLIYEKSSQPGGAAKTAEITRPGFKHDLFATNIGLFLGSRLYRDFGPELHRAGFEIAVAERPFASVFPDGDAARIFKDAEKTMQEMERQSAHDAQAWSSMVGYFNAVAPYLLPLLQIPVPSWKSSFHIWRIFRKLGREKAYELFSLLVKSAREFLDEWYESDKVKALLAPWGFHMDFGSDMAGGATFSFLETVFDYSNGMALSKGGVGALIDSMVKVFMKYGGRLLPGQEVGEIVVHNGRAVGIKTAEGRAYCKKAVLANVSPTLLVKSLLKECREVPSSYLQKAANFRHGPGTMMIHLALDGPLKWQAGDDLSGFNYVHIGPYLEDISITYNQALNGRLPRNPFLVVGQQSAVDPTRAPAGRHTLWVQVRALPDKPRVGRDRSSGDWDQMKEYYADLVMTKIGKYAPNIHEVTMDRVVFSPLDLARENPNLVGGDSIGGSHHLDQNFVFRPVPGYAGYRTPIKGLFLTGASTWPGCGLNATSGYLAAQEILKTK